MYLHVLVLQITMLDKTVGERRGVSRGPEEKPGICRYCSGVGLYWGNKVKFVGFTLLFYFLTPCCPKMKYNHRKSNRNHKWDFKVSYTLEKKVLIVIRLCHSKHIGLLMLMFHESHQLQSNCLDYIVHLWWIIISRLFYSLYYDSTA